MINRVYEEPTTERAHNLHRKKRSYMGNLPPKKVNISPEIQINQLSSNISSSPNANNKCKQQKIKQLIAQKYRAFNRDKHAIYLEQLRQDKANVKMNLSSQDYSKDSIKNQDNLQITKFQYIPNISVYPFDTGDSWITYNNSIYSLKESKKANNFKQPSWMNRIKQIKKNSPEKVKNSQSTQLNQRLILQNRNEKNRKKRTSLPVFSPNRKKNPLLNVYDTKNNKLQALLLSTNDYFLPQSPLSAGRRPSHVILDSSVKYKNSDRNLSLKFRKTMQNAQNRYPQIDADPQKYEIATPGGYNSNFIRNTNYNLNSAELAWFPSSTNLQKADQKFIPILNLILKGSQGQSQKQTDGENEMRSQQKQINFQKLKIQPW